MNPRTSFVVPRSAPLQAERVRTGPDQASPDRQEGFDDGLRGVVQCSAVQCSVGLALASRLGSDLAWLRPDLAFGWLFLGISAGLRLLGFHSLGLWLSAGFRLDFGLISA